MTTRPLTRTQAPHRKSFAQKYGFNSRFLLLPCATMGLGLLLAVMGCQTQDSAATAEQIKVQREGSKVADVLTVREGDVLKIEFPGTPALDATQTVRRDGKITMGIIGEIKAAGLTPADLEKQLIQLYASQLVSKEVSVTVVSSSFPVFVTGAVIRPGKIISDHPITALEAIMEAGGFDNAKADMKRVKVIRNEDGRTRNYVLNLKDVLDGTQNEPFYLKPSDIIYIPERFTWF